MKISRVKSAQEVTVSMGKAVAEQVWACSDKFLLASDVDDPAFSPLQELVWDQTTARYRSNDEMTGIQEDDFIVQAMVVWTLYRLEMGIGRPAALQQLSVWGATCTRTRTEKWPNMSHLPNLWENETSTNDDLVGRGLTHPDNFETFCKFFSGCKDKTDNWARRPPKAHKRRNCYILAEQSVVQWAIAYCESTPHYASLAAAVIRMEYQRTRSGEGDPEALTGLLLEQAIKASGDGSFCRLCMEKIEEEGARSSAPQASDLP